MRLSWTYLVALGAVAVVTTGCGAAPTNSWLGLGLDDEHAYLAGGTHIYAVSLTDGKEAWRFPKAGATVRSGGETFLADPGVSTDMIVVGSWGPGTSHSGAVYGLDPATGDQKWCLVFDDKAATEPEMANCQKSPDATAFVLGVFLPPIDNRVVGGVTLQDGVAYFGMANNHVYAVDATDGTVKWIFDQPTHPVWAAPVIDGDRVLVSSFDHSVYAIDRATGNLVWQQDMGAALAGGPVVADGTLFVGTFGNKLVALDSASGAERWSYTTNYWVWDTPTLVDGVLYFSDLQGTVYAVTAADGSEVWRQAASGFTRAAPAVTNGLVYVGDHNGNLVGLKTADGSESWRQTVKGQLQATPRIAPAQGLVLILPYQGDASVTAFTLDGTRVAWAYQPTQ
ncbi:MAG: PQQ-like beta-propeller repeat protein [Anaerolineales bacterium]|nr:PQQ-like beta-propeller repeat protein [Anaerolineales bacterium]